MRAIQLFRVLLPSWKFFDRVASVPRLWVRFSQDGKSFSDWIDRLPRKGSRDWGRLFLNPRENKLFAAHSLLSQFAEAPEEGASKDLVVRLALHGLTGDPVLDESLKAAQLQFRIEVFGRELFLSQPIAVLR